MDKKYELTDETIKLENGTVLHRIKALRDFGDVKKGELGGWIEKGINLSHNGRCWIYCDALVYGDAEVFYDAKICDNARVYGTASIFGTSCVFDNAEVYGCANVGGRSRVYNDARIHGFALIIENAQVFGNADICGRSTISGMSNVYGNATIEGFARISGNIKLSDNATIISTDEVFCIGPMGRRDDYTTFYKCRDDKNINVVCGCFHGTIDEFGDQVMITHKDNERHLKQYMAAIRFAKVKLL